MNPRCKALCRKTPDLAERATVIGSLVLLSAGYFYAAITRAIVDHFWMDEVLAVSAARQPALSQVWQAIWRGTDFSPPTYHFLLHGFVRAVGATDSHLVWRIPSILAVYGAALCTYLLLVKSHSSRLAAVLGFGIVLGFGLFDYAIQARQYGLLTLGLAIALVLWSRIDDARVEKVEACCLWLVLAVCLGLHFYGVIEVAAIGTAELVYWISRRQFRITVWTVLLLTVPVEIALYPLASHLAAFNAGDNLAPGYYASPTIGRLFDAVFEVIGGGVLGTLLLLSAFLVMGIEYLQERSDRRLSTALQPVQPGQATVLPKLEIVIISLCALPLIAFAFSLFITGSFSTRYMVAGALLPAIAFPYLLDKLPSRRLVALALVPLIVGILIIRSHAPDPIADALTVLQKPRPSLPIVVGEGLLFIELMEAADPSTKSKLVYLKRPAGSSSPDPTNENQVIRLATFHPDYRISEQPAFLAGNVDFYELYRPNMSTDTTTPALIEKGILANPVDAEHGILLFRASSPTEVQQGAPNR
jgi:hypothetical protein